MILLPLRSLMLGRQSQHLEFLQVLHCVEMEKKDTSNLFRVDTSIRAAPSLRAGQ